MTTRPARETSVGRCRSRNSGLLSRSGETSSTSTVSSRSRAITSSHSCRFAELIVSASTPARPAAETWSRISASSGGDQDGRPGSALAQQQCRDEVDRRLPPSRALDDESAPPLVHQRRDSLVLPVVEVASGRPTRSRRCSSARAWVDAAGKAVPVVLMELSFQRPPAPVPLRPDLWRTRGTHRLVEELYASFPYPPQRQGAKGAVHGRPAHFAGPRPSRTLEEVVESAKLFRALFWNADEGSTTLLALLEEFAEKPRATP